MKKTVLCIDTAKITKNLYCESYIKHQYQQNSSMYRQWQSYSLHQSMSSQSNFVRSIDMILSRGAEISFEEIQT